MKMGFSKHGTLILMVVFCTTLSFFTTAEAQLLTFNPTADGDTLTFGGDFVETGDERLVMFQSGANIRNVILEFDLSSLGSADIINSVSLGLYKDGNLANIGGNPAPIEIYGYLGDGVIDIADYDAAATQLGSGSIALGQPNGTALNFSLSTPTIQSAVDASGLLTLRLETNSFATVNFASLETTTAFSPPTLTLDVASNVPEPSALALLFGVSIGLCGIRRRKTKQA